MRLPQPDIATKDEKDSVYLQSERGGETFALQHIWVRQEENTHEHACPRTRTHTHTMQRLRQYKSNHQALWPKAALSAMLFIFGHLLSVWLHELFISGMCGNDSTAVDETKLQGCMAGEP